MSKRTTVLAAALALVFGGAIGFAWHAPGRPSTWDGIRTWIGFAVVVIGVVIALVQLELQRRQLKEQQGIIAGEIERNKRRDQLLDAQIDELEQRKRVLEREQADKVGLSFSTTKFRSEYIEDGELYAVAPGERVHMAVVTNESHRSIRDVRCRWGIPSYDDIFRDDTAASNLAVVVGNTRDFRCLWRSGLLLLSCSVSVFESGCVVPPLECGQGSGPRVAAGTARGSTVRGPGGRGGFSFLTVPASVAGYEKPGSEYGDPRFPGDGLLGRGGVPEFRAGFLSAF